MNLQIPPGQFVSVVGPSGSGKSTLLRLIAKLLEPDTGEIILSERWDSRMAFVFQEAQLLPWKNALQNVLVPLRIRKTEHGKSLELARQSLSQLRIEEAARLYPAQLSGGMKMRVSLARALVTQPLLLLLDEPFAALDEIARQHLGDQLRALWLKFKMTVVFVTHNISEAVYLSDRVIVLSERPGCILSDNKIKLPAERTPQLRMTPEFVHEVKGLYEVLMKGSAP